FSSRRRHTRSKRDWSSDVCSSDLESFMLSHLSAPQAQCEKHFACPVLRSLGMLRFSHFPADARRSRIPPAPGHFRPPLTKTYFRSEERRVGKESKYLGREDTLNKK